VDEPDAVPGSPSQVTNEFVIDGNKQNTMTRSPQVPFTQDCDVIEAFAPDRADHALYVGILPR
jgi:hypothetical protein